MDRYCRWQAKAGRCAVRLGFAAACSVAGALAACGRPSEPDPRMVGEWVHTLYGAIRVERMSPPVASRLMTYATTALYAGFAAADENLPQLAGTMRALPNLPRGQKVGDIDGGIAAIEAERVVLDSLFRDALATTRSAIRRLADSLASAREASGVSPGLRARSTEVGRQIGLAIVAWSHTDGFEGTRARPPYVPPKGLGLWINDAPTTGYTTQNFSGASELVTPSNPANQMRGENTSDRGLILSRPKPASKQMPMFNITGITEPYWADVKPFALERWDACPIPEPPTYGSASSTVLYKEAAAVRDAGTALTSEQRTIALYWADNAGESGTPVGHWLSIASQMSSGHKLSAPEAARTAMITAVSQADAFIAIWGYKFRYNLIRPRTYIRRVIDPAWEPLIPTPPFPEYPSGHSGQSAAAATVLTALLGAVPFEDSTSVPIGHAVRRFDSFIAAAEEAGMSRVYGGIHFPIGNISGRELGKCVGAKVLQKFKVTSRQ